MKRVIGGEYTDQISALEAENREVAYEAAVESMVLLKNDGGLPFTGKEVALFGVGADYTIKGGTGSGEVNNRHSVSILEGLTEAGITVSTMAYLKEYREKEEACHKKWIKENTRIPSAETAMINYRQPEHRPVNQNDFESSTKDMAVYVVSRQSGEGADKKIADNDFDLTALEVNDIRYLSSCFKHLCVVINSGTSMDLSPIDDLNLSLVFYGQAGQEGGRAFADLLSGKENFSGKLSTTWVKKYSDILTEYEMPASLALSRNTYTVFCKEKRMCCSKSFRFDSHGFTSVIDLSKPQLVFFSVPYSEGWTAEVNGAPADVERVDEGFMAVRADTGENTIVFRYKTPYLRTGIIISLCSAAVLVIYVLIFRRKRGGLSNMKHYYDYTSCEKIQAAQQYCDSLFKKERK